MWVKIKNRLVGDENKPMYKSRGIIFIALTGISYAVYSAYLISYSLSHLEQCRPFHSYDCLDNLMVNMKYPLAILTATLTLAGFWALLFRSHQTTRQIAISLKQIDMAQNQAELSYRQTETNESNIIFNNFVAHKKEFMEMLGDFENECKCRVKYKPMIYKHLFPNNSFRNWEHTGDKQYIETLHDTYNKLVDKITREIPNILQTQLTSASRTAFYELFTITESFNSSLHSLSFECVKRIPPDNTNTSLNFELRSPLHWPLANLDPITQNFIIRLAEFADIEHCIKRDFSNTKYNNLLSNSRLIHDVITDNSQDQFNPRTP